MPRKFSLNARNMELRLANTGVTIQVLDDNPDRSGRLQITRAGVTWTPKRKWQSGPRSVRIGWDRVPDIFRAQAAV